ncbi:bifunctional DNA primase/polymerase [Caldiplasma sukawensis]
MNTDISLFLNVTVKRFKDMNVSYKKLKKGDKKPLEKRWQIDNNYSAEEITDWIIDGNNYGIVSMDGTVVFIDADTKEIQEDLNCLTDTLHYSTGKPEHMHYIYKIDRPIENIPLLDGAYVKGKHGYIVGIGSVHPNGTVYGGNLNDKPIASIKYTVLERVLEPYILKTDITKQIQEHSV